jgi:tRNA nucleotidyltransferase/poly(A) polymerase
MHFTEISRTLGKEPLQLCRHLHAAGHDAVVVGGAARSLALGRLRPAEEPELPKDVDLATSATPGQVRDLFSALGYTVYTVGRGELHGTVGIVGQGGEKIEVSTFRHDLVSDGRHAVVRFGASLPEDLERRDFTVNAMAIRPGPGPDEGELLDPFGGRADLELGVLRAVGKPELRFEEDYLRVLRAYRFAARYGLAIESNTRAAIRRAAPMLATRVSAERIRDELLGMCVQAIEPGRLAEALEAMREDGVLQIVLPELAACHGVTQPGPHHAHDVFGHIVRVADHAGFVSLRDAARLPEKEARALPAEEARRMGLFRFAALLHDVGKPMTRELVLADGPNGVAERARFLGHAEAGARIAADVTRRLRFSGVDARWVCELVAQHMRLLEVGAGGVSPRGLRRLAADLRHVDLRALLAFRVADKLGSGREASEVAPGEVARVLGMIEAMEASRPALRPTDLALRGEHLRDLLGIAPSDRSRLWEIGATQKVLLARVLESNDPEGLNQRGALVLLLPDAHTEALRDGPRVRRQL